MTLIVPLPPHNTARLRFVTTEKSTIGKLIRIGGNEGQVSHVEGVLADGSIVAAHLWEGVRHLAGNYDTTSTLQILVDIPMSAEMYARWRAGLLKHVGYAYDWKAILGFAFHNKALHDPHALICSALQLDELRACGHYARPLAQAYHAIDPLTLLLMQQADARTIIHATERA